MADKLQGKRVAFLATDMVEQVELTEPWKAVKDAGGTPELVSLKEGEIQGFNHYDKADTFKVDRPVEEARAEDYDALVIPGGVGNPDTMRTDENAVQLVRDFFEQGKPRGDLPRAVDVGRGRRRARPQSHLVALVPDRHPERRRRLGRPASRGRYGSSRAASPTTFPPSTRRFEEFCEGRHEQQAASVKADATPS